MTRYSVVWLKDALDELAQIWLDSKDRPSITRASAAIDATLAVEPRSKGEHLSEGLWRLRMPPLEVAFAVRDEDGTVEISNIKTIRVRGV